MNSIGRRFLILFLPSAIIFLLIISYFYLLEVNKKKFIRELNESLQVKLGKQFIEKELEATISDLKIISQHKAFNAITGLQASKSLENLEQEFIIFASNKHYYDQVRFLDETGKEVIRINNVSGVPYIVSQDQLQSKGQRYYFIDTLHLKEGEVFISPLDLNVEHGKVEVPFKPILRFATPVFYGPEKKRGVVLFNYLGSNLIQAFKEPIASNENNAMLLNADGYWLYSPRKELEWGFMLGHDHTANKHFPDAWKQIRNTNKGHFYNSNGLFTFSTVYPLLFDEWKSDTLAVTEARMSSRKSKDINYYWKIVTHVSSQDLNTAAYAIAKRLLLISTPFLGLLIIGTWWLAQAQIRRQEAEKSLVRFKSTLDKILDCVFMFDPKSLNFFYVNQSAVEQVGYSHDQLMQMTPVDIKPDFDRAEFRQMIKSLIEEHDHAVTFETIHQHKDGRFIQVEISLQYVSSVDEPACFVAIVRDISERQQLQKQLQQSQKMQAIGQLTGGIAHDFNNILVSIIGYTKLANEGIIQTGNERIKGYLDQVYESSIRARDLVAQMLTFTRGGEGELKPLLLSPLINESLKMLGSILPSSVELDLKLGDNEFTVMTNPVHLHQVIMNLCINARDAMNGKGCIRISSDYVNNFIIDCRSCHEKISGDYVALSFCDTGTGIKPEELNQIFDPFYSTKDVGKGTGMGLSIVHGIVHDHGGHIIVKTEMGKGATFTLLFPIVENQVNDIKIENSEIDMSFDKIRDKNILIVDDDVSVGSFIDELLKVYGCNVSLETNSQTALLNFTNDPTLFDLVVTDQTMPGMTGGELAQLLLEIRPELPVVLCTGYSDYINKEKARSLGIRGYINKPIESEEFLKLVNELL